MFGVWGLKLSEAAGKMLFSISVLSSASVIAGFLYYRSVAALPFAAGIVLMYGTNILRIVMLDRTAGAVALTEGMAYANRVKLQYLARQLLTALVLVIAALTPYVSLWGAAAGIVTWSVAAYSLRLFIKH